MSVVTVPLRLDQYSNLEKLAIGALSPLQGFMDEREFMSVVDEYALPDGRFFPYPIALDVNRETADAIDGCERVLLSFDGVVVGDLRPSAIFSIDRPALTRRIFGVDDPRHPGVRRFLELERCCVAGPVQLTRRIRHGCSERELLPAEAKAMFAEKGWSTVVGFATRNVPHRGHEYLQRLALEQADGLFVHATISMPPTVGFTPEAILAAYDAMIEGHYGPDRAQVSLLSTPSYLAGPREALLQALLRRNYGCTHFIIGRDHSGVGGYYGDYDAHALSERFEDRLGIAILRMRGPYFCTRCDGVVTDRHCRHHDDAARLDLKGTDLREQITRGAALDPRVIRPCVVDAIRRVQTIH